MLEPFHLTIRFRAQGDAALLDLETDDGAGGIREARASIARITQTLRDLGATVIAHPDDVRH